MVAFGPAEHLGQLRFPQRVPGAVTDDGFQQVALHLEPGPLFHIGIAAQPHQDLRGFIIPLLRHVYPDKGIVAVPFQHIEMDLVLGLVLHPADRVLYPALPELDSALHGPHVPHHAAGTTLLGAGLYLFQCLDRVARMAGDQIHPGHQRRAHKLQLKLAAIHGLHQAPVGKLQHLVDVAALFKQALRQANGHQPLGVGAQYLAHMLFQLERHSLIIPRPIAEVLAAIDEGGLAARHRELRHHQTLGLDLPGSLVQYLDEVGAAPVGQADVQIDQPALSQAVFLRVRVARGIFLQHGIPALALRGVQRQRVEHTPRRDQVGRGAYFLLRQGQIGGRQLIVIATAGVAAGIVDEEGVDLFLALAVLIQLQCPGDVALFFADGACTAEQLIFPHPIADRLHPQLHAVDDGGPQGVTAVFDAEQVAHLGSLGQQAVHIAPPGHLFRLLDGKMLQQRKLHHHLPDLFRPLAVNGLIEVLVKLPGQVIHQLLRIAGALAHLHSQQPGPQRVALYQRDDPLFQQVPGQLNAPRKVQLGNLLLGKPQVFLRDDTETAIDVGPCQPAGQWAAARQNEPQPRLIQHGHDLPPDGRVQHPGQVVDDHGGFCRQRDLL